MAPISAESIKQIAHFGCEFQCNDRDAGIPRRCSCASGWCILAFAPQVSVGFGGPNNRSWPKLSITGFAILCRQSLPTASTCGAGKTAFFVCHCRAPYHEKAQTGREPDGTTGSTVLRSFWAQKQCCTLTTIRQRAEFLESEADGARAKLQGARRKVSPISFQKM